MSALVILAISIAVLVTGYVVYGSWLAKQWGIDPTRETPAHTLEDGKDYVPAKAPVLLGHHFASIAGAGPINGPIQAAVFGWLPVLIWVFVGGIFFGAMQDFSSLLASVRHEGKSIGYIIEKNVGLRAKRLFLIFSLLTLLLVIAAFASIVAGTFNGFNPDGSLNSANGSTATASILFILVAIVFGALVHRKNAPLSVATVLGVLAITLCIIAGLSFPIYVDYNVWLVVVLCYIFISSVTPVWILLQPRDYLNSFLLYGMMLAAIIGVIGGNPTINLPAFTGFQGINGNYPMFPMLFITVACGAVSGFHSLIASGTTSKQLDNEADAKPIGFGGMLIECGLSVIALITVGMLFEAGGSSMPAGAPTQIFAEGIATMFTLIGFESAYDTIYAIIILSVSAFCLTSLDTCTRLARYMFKEFFVNDGDDEASITGIKKLLINPFFATGLTVAIGGAMSVGGYAAIWPLFGSANQLLAALAFLAIAAWLKKINRNYKMFIIPMAFMLCATITALFITIKSNFAIIVGTAEGVMSTAIIQSVFGVLLIVLAIDLANQGCRIIFSKDDAVA